MKRTSAQMFYRIFNRVSDLDIPESAGDFRLMDRQVVEALKQLPERNRFMKGLFAWVGFRQIGIPYARPERAAGTSSMGYRAAVALRPRRHHLVLDRAAAGLVGDRLCERRCSRWRSRSA